MAHSIGFEGIVTSWAGTTFNIAKMSPANINGTITADSLDTTIFAASLEAAATTPGLRQWSAVIEGMFPAAGAKTGHQALLSWSGSEYDVLVRRYSLNWTAPVFDGTQFDGVGVTWRTFLPGIYSWNASLDAGIDDTTALSLPHAASASAGSLTMKLLEDGSPDRSFTGSAWINSVSPAIVVNGLNSVTIGIVGTGALTSVGTDNLWAAGAIVKPIAGELVFQAASGRTFTGDAFASSVSIDVPVDGLIRVSVTAQGTGALAIG